MIEAVQRGKGKEMKALRATSVLAVVVSALVVVATVTCTLLGWSPSMVWEWTAPAETKFLTINLADGTVCECRGEADGGIVIEMAEKSVTPPSAAPSHAAEETQPRFTVFAPDEEPASITVLLKTLCPGRPERVQVAKTAREALDSSTDLLVLFMDRPSVERYLEMTKALPELEKKRIIGIGYWAATLFGDLGLEIRAGACAYGGVHPPPRIRVQRTDLLPGRENDTIMAFRMGSNAQGEDTQSLDYNFMMHLPRGSEMTRFVEAIVRCCDNENYASIVRQGNYIMAGLAAPPTTWTDDYRRLFTTLADRFARAPRVPFCTATWEETRPGQYEFDLAPTFSPNELYDRTLYFRFTRATKFSAILEHTGSHAVMIHFGSKNATHAMREDAHDHETLKIATDISQEDIERAGTDYWSLDVANFDRAARARCKLRVEY
jgi:hypothetical protein